jgi:hypothetical protein
MPALYKFPPHPLCPGIQFKQLNPYLEDEPPPCSEPPLRDSPSAGAESARVSPLPMRDPHSHHGAPAAGAHHEAAARANGGHSSVSFEKPQKESRRQRERELSGLELKIPYSMARVPECTITSSGIHVSAIAVFAQSSRAVQLPARCTRAPWAPQGKDCALPSNVTPVPNLFQLLVWLRRGASYARPSSEKYGRPPRVSCSTCVTKLPSDAAIRLVRAHPLPRRVEPPKLGRCEPLGSVHAVLCFFIVSIMPEFPLRNKHRLSLAACLGVFRTR